MTSLHYSNEVCVGLHIAPWKTQTLTHLSDRGVAVKLVTLLCNLCKFEWCKTNEI